MRWKPRNSGICFAWLPTWTQDEGTVWLEWLHWERNDGGANQPFAYWAWVSEEDYDAGKRAGRRGQ